MKLLTFLMAVMMGMLIANKCIFTHTHILANGSVVTHSHPFDKPNDPKPYKTHNHTNAEFLSLDALDVLFPAVFVALAFGLFYRKARYPFQISLFLPAPFFNTNKGRAPPIS
jgi:hypothetical protein